MIDFLKQEKGPSDRKLNRVTGEIDTVLQETGSPRTMFPHVQKSRRLKILPPQRCSSESSQDDNDDDFEESQLKQYLKTRNQKVYMFSQFMKVTQFNF